MKICFYFFLAKLQFDFDVQIHTHQFCQYETYRNSFAIWKKVFFSLKVLSPKGFSPTLKIYRFFYRPSGVVFSMSLKPRPFIFLSSFRRTVIGRYNGNLNFLLIFQPITIQRDINIAKVSYYWLKDLQ